MKAFYQIAAIAAAAPALADTDIIPGLQQVPGPSEELAKELLYRAYGETRDACLYGRGPDANQISKQDQKARCRELAEWELDVLHRRLPVSFTAPAIPGTGT